ncbi:keratin-associated protein 10-4-like [Littorina saxatilis]|uniref:WAP domain-containing protein n=1 Tax=Littorina saxatilis TaxID=31220 RepID=A0AAN9GGS3_9CAEN
MKMLCLLLTSAAVVTGQFLPTELASTCASTSCFVGTPCREVLNPTSGIVSGRCLSNAPQSGNNVCSIGTGPLLVSSSSGDYTQAFCGRGPSRITCPSGWKCNIAPNDAYAVCCQNNDVNPAPPTLPPPAPIITCAMMLCDVGFTCRDVAQSDGTVSSQCLANVPASSNERNCASGKPLLTQNAAGSGVTEAFCGRGPSRITCPSRYRCNVEPADAYAICCEIVEKSGQCPVPAAGEIGICANTCASDQDCGGEQKCCRNGCGATVCQSPVTPNPSGTCDTMNCEPNQTCEMLYPPCAPGSTRCDPIPTCVDKKEKTGECPAVVNDGNSFGVCAFMCDSDADCRGDEKCCKNECGGMACKDPVTNNPVRTCATMRCGANQRCEMQQVQCSSTSCDPQPMCVDIERAGVCPTPQYTWDLFWRARCQRDCESDAQCKGYQKCCNDYYKCGTKCENPEPTNTCKNAKCSSGSYCVMQQVQCFTTPCFPVPNCVDIANACDPGCNRGYKCQLEWNRNTRTQQPTCVMDPENPPCSPACGIGSVCRLQQPWWCFWNRCSPRPTCTNTRG